MLEFTDDEIRAKAVHLGLVKDGDPIPTASMASRVKAALVEDRRAEAAAAQPSEDGPYVGGQITIRPGAGIELDGQRLPAAAAPVEITVSDDPAAPATVRLTLLVHTVQTIRE